MQKHTKWTQRDTRRLHIAYRMGAKYSWLCQMFGRSSSSINKYLYRSGIRPLGCAKGRTRAASCLTLEEVWAEIHRQERLSPIAEPIAQIKHVKKPVYIKAQKHQKAVCHDGIYCDDLNKPIHYLKSLGFMIRKIQLKWADYVVNAKPLSSCQLLILANRNRCEKGLEPFIVTGFNY